MIFFFFRTDNDKAFNLQISEYCFSFLFLKKLMALQQTSDLANFFKVCRSLHIMFLDYLDPSKDFNKKHRPISREDYHDYLKNLKEVLERLPYEYDLNDTEHFTWPDDTRDFLVTLIDFMLGNSHSLPPSQWEMPDNWTRKILTYLGASGRILCDCLLNRMAIIRAPGIAQGNRLNQSLRIAKGLAGVDI